MKKIIFVLLILILTLSGVYAENSAEEAVILPNGLSAADSFNGRITDRWYSDYINEWSFSGGNMYSDDNFYTKYLYQPFDYNSGDLKSNYYRFVLTFKRDKNVYETAGLVFKQSPTNDNIAVGSVISRGKLYYAPNWKSKNSSRTKTEKTYSLEYILERQGDSNVFEVTSNLYKGSSLERTKTTTNTLNKIYPTIYSYKNLTGKFTDFKAYSVPLLNDSIEFTSLKQIKDEIEVQWSVDTTIYDSVKVVHSTDANINFSSDTLLYNGSSSANLRTDLNNLKDGYIGIIAYTANQYSQEAVMAFEYLEGPDTFGYAFTDVEDAYKYTWLPVEGASEYIVAGQVRYPGNETITLYNIENPETVALSAKKPATVGSGFSESIEVNASLGSLVPVENLTYQINDDQISMTWDHYPGRDYYQVLSINESNTFSIVDDDLVINQYQDTLTNKKVILKYKVKARVAGLLTLDSEILEVKNIVKNINHSFNYSSQTIDVTWDDILDADRYSIRVSSHSDMSSSTEVTTENNGFSHPYVTDSTANQYVEITAISSDGTSTPVIYEVDMSLNQTVDNLNATYTPNSNGVSISWQAINNAIEYHVFKEDTYIGKTNTTSFYGLIENSDQDLIHYSVQAYTTTDILFKSDQVSTTTFSKDVVLDLTATYDETVLVEWASLNRAESYLLEISENSDMSSASQLEVENTSYNYVIPGNAAETLYFRVRGLYGLVTSNYSNIASSSTSTDLVLTEDTSLADKYYNEEMKFDLDFNLERQIYDPIITITLPNTLHPETDELILKYVFPEVVSVSASSALSYTSTVKTGLNIDGVFNSNGGYEVVIRIDDDRDFLGNSTITAQVKTDLMFENSTRTDPNSILYVNGSYAYTWMELPFYILNQVNRLDNYINSQVVEDIEPISANDYFTVRLSYKHNESDIIRHSLVKNIYYSFKNRNIIRGE